MRLRRAGTQPGPWLPVRVDADPAVLEGTRRSEIRARAAAIPSRHRRSAGATPPWPAARAIPTQWRDDVVLAEPGTVARAATRAVLTDVEAVKAMQALLQHDRVRALEPPI